MSDNLPAYSCAQRVAGEKKCQWWCGDHAKCIASQCLMNARDEVQQKYTALGAASSEDEKCMYRPESNAAKWWHEGRNSK